MVRFISQTQQLYISINFFWNQEWNQNCVFCVHCNFILLYLIFWSKQLPAEDPWKILCHYCNFQISRSLAAKRFVWNKSTFILPPATTPMGKGQQNSRRPNEGFFLLWHQLARHWEFQNYKWWYSFFHLFLSSAPPTAASLLGNVFFSVRMREQKLFCDKWHSAFRLPLSRMDEEENHIHNVSFSYFPSTHLPYSYEQVR